MTLVFHPSVQTTLSRLRQHPPQALLLAGPRGVGLLALAQHLAGPHSIMIGSADGAITIEMIRNLYEQTKGKYKTRQFVIIDNAETMSTGAQNAFLKLLEEPTSAVHFILTTHNDRRLLPTIRSRVQTVTVPPITPEQSRELAQTLTRETTKQRQLLYIAEGLPAELYRLTSDETYFAIQAKTVTDARELLKGDSYARLLVTMRYADREAARALVAMALHILWQAFQNTVPTEKAIRQLERLEHADTALLANYNVRLALLQLVL